MLTSALKPVNHCTCDLVLCQHQWDSLTVPAICPKCRSRTWNGERQRGRPKSATPKPPTKPQANSRKKRKDLPEYSREW
jgi:hypothetical protein